MRRFFCLLLLGFGMTCGAQDFGSADASDAPIIVEGHEAVDLGLPSGTLWATCNVDAESPSTPGSYFAWGENETRDTFNWQNYSFYEEDDPDGNGNTTYSAIDLGNNISATQYDVARFRWGKPWRMPTREEYEELLEFCSTEFISHYDGHLSGLPGLRVSAPNGSQIFLTASDCPGNGITPAVISGNYWSATSEPESMNDIPSAVALTFQNSDARTVAAGRHYGMSVRPVISRQDAVNSNPEMMIGTAPGLRYEKGTIFTECSSDGYEVLVADLAGRTICTVAINDGRGTIPDLTKGIYLINLCRDGHTAATLKISVK